MKNFVNLKRWPNFIKSSVFVFVLLFALTAAFADKSRFYENGKVIDTMYVDSAEGLRVRDKPSLKSNRLCVLPHRLPVKVVAIGKEATIDGITAPWVEILIPCYEWKNKNIQEFGWVFGGYLKKEQREFLTPKNKEELTQYLESSFWHLSWFCGGSALSYYGYFENGKIYAVETNGLRTNYSFNEMKYLTTFRAVSGDKYYTSGYSFYSPSNPYTKDEIEQYLFVEGIYSFTNIDEESFSNYGTEWNREDLVWDFYPSKTFFGVINGEVKFNPSEILYNKRIYAIIYGNNTMQRFQEVGELTADFAKKCIEIGISAVDTAYYNTYRSYWNPIMEEHQQKADAMK
ncbi:MAG: SH3 domain-containing protein [Treponema sp.]|nr:SH3 domain-containing protein [Treponema sp.]